MMSYQVIVDLFIITYPKFNITIPPNWTDFFFLSSNIFRHNFIVASIFPHQNPIHIHPHAESIPVS